MDIRLRLIRQDSIKDKENYFALQKSVALLETNDINVIETADKREHIECLITLSKEKYKDVMLEWLEDLEEIKNFGEEKDKIIAKIADMKSRLINKMELMKTINLNEI